jgi:hypothetical protein
MTGVVSKASDWWSVGVIMMELLQGIQPFDGLDERAINFALVMRGIIVPKEVPTDWQTLLKGLLTRDHAKRWNEVQIRQWLQGKGNIPVYYNEATETPVVRIRKHRPCQFLKTDYFEPADLAMAMAEQWDEAAKRFERGIISEWIKKEVQNADLASLLIDVQEDASLNTDQKLSVALLAMNDEFPLSWRGEVVNQDWMAAHPEIGVQFLKSDLSSWLKRLRQETWLEELKDRYLDLKRQVNSACSEETMLKAALATDALLLQSGQKAQQDYYSSTDSQLNHLLSNQQLTPVEAAVLALAPPTCFVTRRTVAQEYVTEFTSNIKVWGTIQFPTTRSALDFRIVHLRGRVGKLEEELKEILRDGPLASKLMNHGVRVVNDLQVGLDSLLAQRISAEQEVLNELPQQLAANGFDTTRKRLDQIAERFSDIDCSQLRETIRKTERTYVETLILNELPQQLGAGHLRTTKQRLQQIKLQFPDIDCGPIEQSIGEWEAFYHNPSRDVDLFKTDMFRLLNTGEKNLDYSGIDGLDERLSLLRTDIAERQQILNEKYDGTEFNEVAAPVIASLYDRLNLLDQQLQHIKQRHKSKDQRPWCVVLIVVGMGCYAVAVWRLIVEDYGAEDAYKSDFASLVSFFFIPGIFLLFGTFLVAVALRLSRDATQTVSSPPPNQEPNQETTQSTPKRFTAKEIAGAIVLVIVLIWLSKKYPWLAHILDHLRYVRIPRE